MSIRSLDHVVLTCRDIGATVGFYTALGMREERFGEGRIALRFGDQKLNLHQAGAEFDPHARVPEPGSADLCFLLEPGSDPEALARATGRPVELGPVARDGAAGPLRSVYLRDPDGNLVELSLVEA